MSLEPLTADYFIAHKMGHLPLLNHSVSFCALVASECPVIRRTVNGSRPTAVV